MYEALLVRVGFKFWECSGWNIFFQHPTPDIIHERVVYWRCVRMVILLSCSEGRCRKNQNMWYNILRSFVDDRQTVRVIISCVLFCFLIFSSAQKSVSFMNGQIFTALVIILPLYHHISCIVSPAMMWYDRPVYDVMWCDMIWYLPVVTHYTPFPSLPFLSLPLSHLQKGGWQITWFFLYQCVWDLPEDSHAFCRLRTVVRGRLMWWLRIAEIINGYGGPSTIVVENRLLYDCRFHYRTAGMKNNWNSKQWCRLTLYSLKAPVWCTTVTSLALKVLDMPYTKDIQSSIHQSVSCGG